LLNSFNRRQSTASEPPDAPLKQTKLLASFASVH